MKHAIGSFGVELPGTTAPRVSPFVKGAIGLASLFAAAGLAHAQSTAAASPATNDSLTWNGITLYGIVDLGLQYDTHGAPFSDFFPGGSSDIVQKYSNKGVYGVTPSNLSQSRVGLQGSEPLLGDWSGVFKLETFFNPQSGQISDALKSLAQNNGRALNAQTVNLDSSVAGQAFQQAFAGFSSPTYGTLTFGRQNTILADGIAKYDPNAASQAFSLIGLSGTAAGGGDTQDRRLDDSLKYTATFQGLHVGVNYKFGNSYNSRSSALEAQLGYELAGLSIDGYYARIWDAVSAGALSAAQVAELPKLGYSINNSLAGTVSDNTTWSLQALYTWNPLKFYAGYEYIKFANPGSPLAAGFDDLGNYKLAFVNNSAYPNNKYLQVFWGGFKYGFTKAFDLTLAYYGYHQDAYGTGSLAGCSTVVSGTCSGDLHDFSLDGVYKLGKRFDAYAGIMYTEVQNGLANGYLRKNNTATTVGVRFRF